MWALVIAECATATHLDACYQCLSTEMYNQEAMATNSRERKLYEFNARNQITLWGPDGQILDYGGEKIKLLLVL